MLDPKESIIGEMFDSRFYGVIVLEQINEMMCID